MKLESLLRELTGDVPFSEPASVTLHRLLGPPPPSAEGWPLEDARRVFLIPGRDGTQSIEMLLQSESHHLFGPEAMFGEYVDWIRADYLRVLRTLREILGEPVFEGAGAFGPDGTEAAWQGLWHRGAWRISLELHLPKEEDWRLIIQVGRWVRREPTMDPQSLT